jgi:decaprenylphospho-beta-D-erythro-pentofuranosid-2-ulose 2-reductase
MSSMRKIVIVGATSAMAEHCARLWLQQGVDEMVLIGRDVQRTDRVAADLRVRAPQCRIQTICSDFLQPEAIAQTVEQACAAISPDIVLIAHGSLPEQAVCQQDLQDNRTALEVNAISPVLFAEAFATHLEQAGQGKLVLIGSVAGDRGRKSNYVYGAAKGLVTRYAQGLQHRFAGSRIQVVLVKPGPTDTPMTAHLKSSGAKLASVEQVAGNIVSGVARGKAVIYAPAKWQLIMLIIRHLPGFIFNKLDI